MNRTIAGRGRSPRSAIAIQYVSTTVAMRNGTPTPGGPTDEVTRPAAHRASTLRLAGIDAAKPDGRTMSTRALFEHTPNPGARPRAGGVLERARERGSTLALWLQWLPPLLVRVAMGGSFASTGWGKLHHLAKVTGFFRGYGLPAPAFLAEFVGATELVCGCLVFLGLFTRFAASLLVILMAVAIGVARLGDVHGLVDFLDLEELTYALLFFWLVIAGPGRVSLDALIFGDPGSNDAR
jgi:putative oxidoreductase